MRFIRIDPVETYESNYLRGRGIEYAPMGDVTFHRDVEVGSCDVSIFPIDGKLLAIHPDSVSWAFLDPNESSFLENLAASPKKVGNLCSDHFSKRLEFIRVLYRRGLCTLNGNRCTDTDVFRKSHNSPTRHLVELLITEKCNLACGYCLAGANPRMPSMSYDIGRRAIDLAFGIEDAKDITFEFSGGEPFLRFKLMKKLTEYAKSHRERRARSINITVQTNATLLDSKKVKWLQENNVHVGISLDGYPDSHDKSRPQVNGKGSFQRVMHGIELLRHFNVPFGALIVLNRTNIEHPDRLIDFLLETKIHGFKINPIAYLGTGRDTWENLGISSKEAASYFKNLLGQIVTNELPLREANLATMCEYWISKRRADRCLRSHCEAGDTFQAVSANGSIYPCGRATQSPELALGHVEYEYESLAIPARTNPFAKQIRRRRPDDFEDCRTCQYKQLCQAGCSVQAFERFGSVRHKTPECDFYKTLYPWLVRWLTFDEHALAHLGRLGYFGPHLPTLVNHSYLESG